MDRSIADNLFLGNLPRGPLGLVRRARRDRDARALLARVGLDLPPWRLVRSLGIGAQQLVEIARALSRRARVIVMDEPTAPLSESEVRVLFGTVAASGIRTLSKVSYDDNLNLVIVAVSIAVGLIPIAAPEFWSAFPSWLGTIMHSGISAAALVAQLTSDRVVLDDLDIASPTLDDVFTHLTMQGAST